MSRFSKTAQSTGKPLMDDKGFVDSGCSRHITGNITYHSDFKEVDRGYVTFGGGAHSGRIFGKGTLKTDSLDFEDLPDESQLLLKIPRKDNIYSFDMKNIVPKEIAAGTITNESACTQGELNAESSNFDSPSKYVGKVDPKSAADDQKQVEDGPDNENDEKDKYEDDSSPKEVNTAGQHVNTASPEVNTRRFKLNTIDPSVNTASLSNPDSPKDMFTMGASHTLEVTHVEFFNDEDKPEVDLGNILNSYTVLTTPNTRIHKDYLIQNVIGDVKSSVQTRRMTKPTSEQGFLSVVYEQKTHDTLNTYLYACFLSQIEPTSIAKALSNSSWVEAMHEELLQFKLQQKEDGIFISQDKYVAEILKKFNYTDVKSASTLVDLEKPLVKDGDADDVDVHLYRYMIGSLMYLTASRPDIMFAVCKPTLGLWNSKDFPFEIVSYTNSDYAGATQDMKSTTGGYLLYKGFYAGRDKQIECLKLNASPLKHVKRGRDTKIPQSSGPPVKVGDEVVHKELGDRMERAATTASSLEAEQDSATARTTDDGEVKITASIDLQVKTITEASLRRHLKLEDSDGITSLPNTEIFEQLALMGYVSDSARLTFQKGHFSPQWRFFIHTILHCLSPKTTAWEQFSSNIATAIICLATNRTFNFSKMIFDAMVKNLDSTHKFLMYPRFLQICLNKQKRLLQPHTRTYPTPTLTQKLFSNMKRVSKGYSGIPQSQFPTQTQVADKAAFTSVDVDAGGAVTANIGLEACHGSARHIKKVYSSALIKLILRVKKLEKTVKTNKARRRARIVISEDEDAKEDSSKQRRKISEIDKDPTISLVQPEQDMEYDFDVSTAEGFTTASVFVTTTSASISTVSPPRVSTTEDISGAETLVYIRRSAEKRKDKGKAIMKEDESVQKKTKKQLEQERLGHEEAIRLQEQINEEERQRIARDAEIAKQLQEEFDRARQEQEVVAEADQAHDIDWSDPAVLRYHALQNRSFSKAEVRKNMCIYLKNQGGYKLSHFKGMSYEDIRPIFERVWDQNNAFVPKDSEIEKEVMKRPGFDFLQQKVYKKRSREHSEEDSAQECQDKFGGADCTLVIVTLIPPRQRARKADDLGYKLTINSVKLRNFGTRKQGLLYLWELVRIHLLASLTSKLFKEFAISMMLTAFANLHSDTDSYLWRQWLPHHQYVRGDKNEFLQRAESEAESLSQADSRSFLQKLITDSGKVSVLNDALKSMYNAEKRGNTQVMIRISLKVIIKFLMVMQKHGYIGEFEYVDDHRIQLQTIQSCQMKEEIKVKLQNPTTDNPKLPNERRKSK
ncbi:putative ribonuclease H-like domain-containing protein [Tanacetum coccineum]